MNIAELKLQLINKIMQLDDINLTTKAELFLNEKENCAQASSVVIDSSTVVAYRTDGQPLTLRDLKNEILKMTDDTKPATHCSVKTKLKGILWL